MNTDASRQLDKHPRMTVHDGGMNGDPPREGGVLEGHEDSPAHGDLLLVGTLRALQYPDRGEQKPVGAVRAR